MVHFLDLKDVIPALLIRPFENINTILISAVVIEVFLIFISYIYSILNSIKRKDLKEGLFGKNRSPRFWILYIAAVAFRRKTFGENYYSYGNWRNICCDIYSSYDF